MSQLRYTHAQSNLSLRLLKRIVDYFFERSDPNLIGAFAYGSVAFPQYGRTLSNSQLDLIFIVRNPIEWHHSNLIRYPQHYSSLMRHVHRRWFDKIVSDFPGPKVFYNPLVDWSDAVDRNTISLKYGVVSLSNLLYDLLNWSHLYIAGRLHKPVIWIPLSYDKSEKHIASAQHKNLYAALSYGLLQISSDGPGPTVFELFHATSSLSYDGDWRMLFGEDKQKVTRIVSGSERLSSFRRLYDNFLRRSPISTYLQLSPITQTTSGATHQLSWSVSPHSSDCVQCLLDGLPDSICTMAAQMNSTRPTMNPMQARLYLAELCPSERKHSLQKAVRHVVRVSSVQQTMLGLMTAGPARSIAYASAKLKKMFASMGLGKRT